jgi:hypothetical protein
MTRILSSSSRRRVCDHSFADRVCSGCSGWIGENPDAGGGEDGIECLGVPGVAVAEQERDRGELVAEVHHEVAGGLSGPCAGGMRGYAEQVCPAGIVLDRDQRIESSEQHGVHVHEVHRQDRLACAVRNWRQVGPDRRGVGSRPASRRICHTVEAAMR